MTMSELDALQRMEIERKRAEIEALQAMRDYYKALRERLEPTYTPMPMMPKTPCKWLLGDPTVFYEKNGEWT